MPKQISNESENLKIFRFAQNNQRKPWQRNKQLSASQKLVKSCWLIVLPAAQRVMWIMCECKLFENPQPTDSSAPQRGAWVETWHNWGTLTPLTRQPSLWSSISDLQIPPRLAGWRVGFAGEFQANSAQLDKLNIYAGMDAAIPSSTKQIN